MFTHFIVNNKLVDKARQVIYAAYLKQKVQGALMHKMHQQSIKVIRQSICPVSSTLKSASLVLRFRVTHLFQASCLKIAYLSCLENNSSFTPVHG